MHPHILTATWLSYLSFLQAHIVPSEYLHRVADLEIVAPPAGEVFHNADTDFPVFHIVHHAGVGGTVKKPAAFVIVDVVPDIS